MASAGAIRLCTASDVLALAHRQNKEGGGRERGRGSSEGKGEGKLGGGRNRAQTVDKRSVGMVRHGRTLFAKAQRAV